MKKKASNAVYDRPKQETPAVIINDLLRAIRNQFCPDLSDNQWYPTVQFHKRTLTYGASWLNRKGVTLPPARYQAIYQDIFNGIKQHGTTAAVKSWPGYLLHCVQEHFKHHGEDYYNEGKAIRAGVERALLACTRAHDAASERKTAELTEVLAQTHAVLSVRRKAKKTPSKTLQKQTEFGL